jgi:hypothetical protein
MIKEEHQGTKFGSANLIVQWRAMTLLILANHWPPVARPGPLFPETLGLIGLVIYALRCELFYTDSKTALGSKSQAGVPFDPPPPKRPL